MTELFYDVYDGEMVFDIVDCQKSSDEYVLTLKSKYNNETVGFEVYLPIINRKSLFKTVTFVKPNDQIKFVSIGKPSDRFVCALEELLKPVYQSSKAFSEETEYLDYSVINREMYDINSDKIYLKVYNGEDQSDLDEDERINVEMNFSFNLGTNRASLIEVRDGYSADLVAVLMK